MTPKERFGAFLSARPMDRLLVSPLILNWASRAKGLTVRAYCTNGRNMAEALVACWRAYGHDVVYVFSTTSTLAEAMGTVMDFPEDDAPQVKTPLVRGREDLARLRPLVPERDGRLPVYLEAVERCVAEIGGEVHVVPVIGAPMTTSCALRGTETLIRELYTDPALVHALLRAACDAAKTLIDAYAARGAVPVLVEPCATGSMISDRHFREFALPYLKEIYAHIHGKGLPGVLHICGRTRRILASMADSGADVLSLDDVDLAEARALVGDRVCLMGNVSPADGMLKGTPASIRAMTREAVAKAAGNPRGYIVATGCEVPIHTPPENMRAFLDAGREFARLPVWVA
jgi:uroporphyrinogen decarboxylase